MWANVGFVTVGVALVGTAATLCYVHWKDIDGSNAMSGLFRAMDTARNIGERFLNIAPDPLTEDELKYTIYSSPSDDSSTGPDITFGRKYGKLLVGDKNNGYDWWKETFKARKDGLTEGDVEVFSGAKNIDENKASEDIKKKCEEVYKKKNSELKIGDRKNAWILCSPLKTEPYGASQSFSYRNKFAGQEAHKDLLLEDRPINRNAWRVLYEKFFKDNTQDTKSTEFQKIISGYPEVTASTKDDGNPSKPDPKTTLNRVCGEGYLKTADEVKKVEDYRKNILKFCSYTNVDLSSNGSQ